MNVKEMSPARLAALEEQKREMNAFFQAGKKKNGGDRGKYRPAPKPFTCSSCGRENCWRPDRPGTKPKVCVNCELR